MNTRVLMAVIAAAVFYFFAGWAIFGIALHDFYAEGTTVYEGLMNEMPDMMPLALMNITWACLIVMVIHKTDAGTLKGGLMTGLWVGFLMVVSFNLSMAAFYNLMSTKLLIADTVIGTLFTAAGGALGGFVLGYGIKE